MWSMACSSNVEHDGDRWTCPASRSVSVVRSLAWPTPSSVAEISYSAHAMSQGQHTVPTTTHFLHRSRSPRHTVHESANCGRLRTACSWRSWSRPCHWPPKLCRHVSWHRTTALEPRDPIDAMLLHANPLPSPKYARSCSPFAWP